MTNRAGQGNSHPALSLIVLHCLVDHTADGVRCLPLHPLGDVGVGVQGETCAVVAQSVGQGFHIYTVLQRQGCECLLLIRN